MIRKLVLRWRNPSRYFIIKKVIPEINNKKVLWVGVAKYCVDEVKKLEKNNDVTTLDINSELINFGAKKHIVDDISTTKLDEEFDFIFLLGVLGYGVDLPQIAEKTFRNCYRLLKTNGILIVSVLDVPKRNYIKIRELRNYKLFYPSWMFGLDSGNQIGKTKMEINFLRKK